MKARIRLDKHVIDLIRLTGNRIELPQTNASTRLARICRNKTCYITKEFIGETAEREAEFEYRMLQLYRELGLHVPRPIQYDAKDHRIVMEDLGVDTLELRLVSAGPLFQNRIALNTETQFETVCDELRRYHSILEQNKQRIESILDPKRSPAPLWSIEQYYSLLSPPQNENSGLSETDLQTSFLSSVKPLMQPLESKEQPIHGDIKTSHIIFKKNGEIVPYIIDLGSSRWGVKEFDIACLLFAPDLNQSPQEAWRFYQKKFKPSQNEGTRFLSAGLLNLIRYYTYAVRRKNNPSIAREYVLAYPGYANPSVYRYRLNQLLGLLRDEYLTSKDTVSNIDSLLERINSSFANPGYNDKKRVS